jgi:ribonuclease E
MAKDLLINVSEGEECRIALLEDGRLQELYMERTSSTSHVGNIYKGRVTNVEASIQAAFVDFGLGRNGFLHISDLMPTYFGRAGEDIQETVGRKMARRDRPPIQRCLRRGDEIVVQIIKEGIGTKGPTLTTYLSVPGKILVMMPGVGKSGVSRKIEDEDERRRLRRILDELDPPNDAGFIIRTAGIGASKAEIQRDLAYLARLWGTFKKKRDSGPGPVELYTEGDLITRTVRDVFTNDVDRLIIDNKEVVRRVKEVIKLANPRTKNKVEQYEDPIPMFDKFGVEREIEMMYSRHVPLPSGGSLVIDSTEAIVAIDVNSGKSRDFSDAETTAFKTDLEAADEICRQLKLRDLGGVIICDFIDLRYERHRRELWNRLDHNLKNDRAKTKVLPMSQFGIIEMTRQRMRPSLKRSVYFDCPHCKGAGLVKTPESMSLDVMRRLRIAIHDQRVARVELAVCSDVAFYLQNKKRQQIGELEAQYQKRIVIRADATLGLDEMRVNLFDNREGVVIVEGLANVSQPPHTTQLGTRPYQQQRGRGGRGGGAGRDDRQRQDTRRQGPPQHREEEAAEERFDRVEAEVEDREEGSEAPEHFEDHGEERPEEVVAEIPSDDQAPRDDRAQRDDKRDQGRRDNRPQDDRQRAQRDNRDQRDQRGTRDQRDRGSRDQRDNRDNRGGDNRGGPRHDQRQPQGANRDNRSGSGDVRFPNRGGQGPDNRPNQQGPAQGNNGQNGDAQQGGRRRRRRGRRGRGRNRQDTPQGEQQPISGDRDQHRDDRPPFEDDRDGPQGDRDRPEGYQDERPTEAAQGEEFYTEETVVEGGVEAPREGLPVGESRDDREGPWEELEHHDAERESEREPSEDEEIDADAEPVAEAPRESGPRPEEESPAEEAKSKRRRATTTKRAATNKTAEKKPRTAKAKLEKKTTSRRKKPKSDDAKGGKSSAARGEAPASGVRVKSADKHLTEDEPILPQPLFRPRSARDLDSIPDDFDE